MTLNSGNVTSIRRRLKLHQSAQIWWSRATSAKHQVFSICTWQFPPNFIKNKFVALGFVCMECSILARCVFRNNGWEAIPLELCDAGQNLYCNANEQRCSASPGPCNPGQGGSLASCTSAGVLYARSFHACNIHNLIPVPVPTHSIVKPTACAFLMDSTWSIWMFCAGEITRLIQFQTTVHFQLLMQCARGISSPATMSATWVLGPWMRTVGNRSSSMNL